MRGFIIGRFLGIVKSDPEPVEEIVERLNGHSYDDPGRHEHGKTFDCFSHVSSVAVSATATFTAVAEGLKNLAE